MSRRLAALLAADIAGYSRLTGADEEGTVARLRALRAELIDPAIASHAGRIVKTAGDGMLIEFASVVDAVRAAVAVQSDMARRNARLQADRRIEFRVGIHLGDVLVQPDGDLLGDGVNIAARLEGICEPGGICLSRAAHEQVEGKVEAAFADLGEKALKNIARPVQVFSIMSKLDSTPANAGVHRADAQLSTTMDPRVRGGGDKLERAEAEAAPRLSIVVLPFANLGGDPEQEYFVDGVTESLTTDLSRISGSFVIARNTAFTYKGKPVDVKQIGRELNVRYVLEGSVQRGGNRLRVNVQLIETESGAHIWAERFDKRIADLFDMQDEIVARLANQLSVQLIAAEARRIESLSSSQLSSIELTLRARSLAQQASLQSLRAARPLYEAALRLDERNVDALVGLAGALIAELESWASSDRDRVLAAAEAAVTSALAIAPDNARAHYVRARLFQVQRKPVEQLREHELVIQLDRNLALAHAGMGFAKIFLGRSQETEAHIAEAIRLSPRDPNRAVFFLAVGAADLYLARCERAADWCRRAIEANPSYELPFFYLAAALALSGRQDEAEAAASAAMRLHPDFRIAKFRAEAFGDSPVYLAQRERLYEGMRLAGVPEGQPEKPAAPRLSIVVLPFAHISGDVEQEYFVDGLTEDLTTELSRIPGAFVIARNTAFTYKGKPFDVKQIGRDLNVRYVLEGSIRRGGNRVRVNAQLIDAESGAHLWADRFDRDLVDLFELQDAVTLELASVLGVQLVEAEVRKSRRIADPTVFDLVLQARATTNLGGGTRDRFETAERLYLRALELEPDNVPALGGFASMSAFRASSLTSADREADLARAKTLAERALRIDSNDQRSHHALGLRYRLIGRFDDARSHDEANVRHNPNSQLGHSELGWICQFMGNYEASLSHFLKAVRLSPRDPFLYIHYIGIGLACENIDGGYQRAFEYYRKSYELQPQWPWSRLMLASAYAQMGRTDEARHFLDMYLNDNPAAKTIAELRRELPSNRSEYLQGLERVYDGLRKAGMAEE